MSAREEQRRDEALGQARERMPAAAVLALVLVLALAGFARVRLVLGSSPYVLHEDELIATSRAARMLETGDFNPAFYRYPSLTIYATAGAFATAHALQGEPVSAPNGTLAPNYERPEIALAGRLLLVGLSLGAMACIGLLASRAFSSPALLVLAPLVLALSPRFLLMSWAYVNVDLVGAFVCSAALAHLFHTRHRKSVLHRALLPGLLCGIAVGTKYYLGLVGLPAAIVLLGDRRRLGVRLVVIVVATLLGFLATTPYCLVDPAFFVDQVMFEVSHYQSGHRGAEGEPGLEQLLYYLGRTRAEFGLWPCVVGLVGIVAGVRRAPRATGLLLAFPLALLLFLSFQRVHFIRNFLSVYALFPIFIALGALSIWSLLAVRLPRRAGGVVAFVLVSLFAFGVPWPRVRSANLAAGDSRNGAVAWIEGHVSPGARVFVAQELMLDTRALEKRYEVTTGPLVSFVRPGMTELYAAERPAPVFVVPQLSAGSSIGEHFGRAVRRQLQRLDERWSGGAHELPRKPPRLLHLGDPALEVRMVAPGQSGS